MGINKKKTASIAGNNMLVAVRMRPLSKKEIACGEKSCCEVIGNKIVAITKEKRVGAVLKSEMGSVNEYQFDEAFDERVPQEEVYERTAKRLIPSVLEGFNVTVFAYGATGAGKTHTMMGSERMDAGEDCSIAPFAVAQGGRKLGRGREIVCVVYVCVCGGEGEPWLGSLVQRRQQPGRLSAHNNTSSFA